MAGNPRGAGNQLISTAQGVGHRRSLPARQLNELLFAHVNVIGQERGFPVNFIRLRNRLEIQGGVNPNATVRPSVRLELLLHGLQVPKAADERLPSLNAGSLVMKHGRNKPHVPAGNHHDSGEEEPARAG